ncbi:MAG: hypothetical protein IJ724_14715 [Muribaculaceae bacterium]|nr:hypothetical protein [Muribaculaceae bacterium]
MTKKLPFRATALACVLLLGMTTMAQVEFQPMPASDVYCPSGKMSANVSIMSYSNQKEISKLAKANVAKAENDLCTVTAILDYDPEQFQAPQFIGLYRNDGYGIGLWDDEGEGVYQGYEELEPGIYDIVALFKKGRTPYYVIYEQYELTGDVTLTLNPESCTNCLTTKIYGPNGELLKHGLGHYDDEGQFVLDKEGEIERTNVNIQFCREGSRIMSSAAQYIGPMLDEESRNCPYEIYVTNVSDRFSFLLKRIDVTKDYSKSYWNWFSSKGITTDIENGINEYLQQVFNYKYTPYGSQQDGCGFQLLMKEINNSNLSYTAFVFNSPDKKSGDIFTHEVWANIPYMDSDIYDTDIFLQPAFNDFAAINTYGFLSYPGVCIGPEFQVKDGQKVFTNMGHYFIGAGNFMPMTTLYHERDYQSGVDIQKLLPAPEAFTYPTDQALDIFGDNCPINAVQVENHAYVKPPAFIDPNAPDGNTRILIYDFFVGRYGEQQQNDSDNGISRTLKLNGEEVDAQTTLYTDGTGTCEYTVTNTNIDVDGIPGQNSTTVYFDQDLEDMTPPSLEMLHFKNSDGGVTDRFATADEGTMEFYASDFQYQHDDGWITGVYLCQPVEVTVEYAPYGTEDWNELVIEEVPELYQEPGWGYFYRGSLASVTGQAEQGWFDLKFRLVDASGNWQEQVISPAFRIDNLAYTSVANIGSGNAHEVARYTLDGRRADASTQGVVIVKMSDGTAKKELAK